MEGNKYGVELVKERNGEVKKNSTFTLKQENYHFVPFFYKGKVLQCILLTYNLFQFGLVIEGNSADHMLEQDCDLYTVKKN